MTSYSAVKDSLVSLGQSAANWLAWRHGDDVAAFSARAQLFVAGELLVNLSYGIATVIADLDGGLVNFIAALVTEPFEVIDFTRPPLALEDDEPRIGFESGRVWHAGGTKEDLAGLDHGGVLFAKFVAVNKILDAGQLQRDFVRRIDVKIPPLFAPAAQEGDGLRILPQDAAAFALGFHILDDAL